MKTPRLTDFDPNAKAPTLKSSLDNMPVIQKPPLATGVKSPTPPSEDKQESNQPVRPYDSTPVRAYERTPSTKDRRRLIRHPFEFYEDQVEELRQLSLQAKLRGEKTSMSELAREALDNFLKEKKNRTPVR